MACNCPDCVPRDSELGRQVQAARKRAEGLLLSFLTERQQEQAANGWFELIGSDGETYRIELGAYSGNVLEFRKGVPYRRWCCYPNYRSPVPTADLILGQVLALRTDAVRFKRIAR